MRRQESAWPHCLGMTGAVIVAGAMIWELCSGYEPWEPLVLGAGVAVYVLVLAAIQGDRGLVLRLECEKRCSEAAALRSWQEKV